MANERYENLNGFRAFAAVGIVIMHVRANGGFGISGFFYDRVIASFTNLTFLFMLLSSFSLCCGYYERFRNRDISLEQFYRRRYQRIWPLFALLCTIELIVEHSLEAAYEWFADLTLAFGLLPNANISVVGVGWFIGVVFAFYMVFPFFVFLIGNRRRAWLTMAATIVLNLLCQVYFFDARHLLPGFMGKHNLIFSSMFFCAGGMIYLYRDLFKALAGRKLAGVGIVAAAVLAFCYTVNDSAVPLLALFVLLTILGLPETRFSRRVFQNRVVRFLGGMSMEIFLCHMFVYRVLERLKLLHLTGNEVVNYCLTCLATLIGTIAMALVIRALIDRCEKGFHKWIASGRERKETA